MGSDTVTPASTAYAYSVLTKWEDVSILGEEVRKNYICGVMDQELLMEYVSKLISLWKEMYPKVKDRSDFGEETTKEFMAFERFYDDPLEIFRGDNLITVFKFEKCLRWILEKVGLTKFEDTRL